MNKKTLTGLMLVIAAGVWAYVGWQFFSGSNYNNNELAQEEMLPTERPAVHLGPQQNLLLNYPDPFLKNETRPPALPAVKTGNKSIKIQPVKKEEKAVATPVYTWPNIVYKGLIQNKTQPDKIIGVIVINGQEKIIRKGEKINELCVSSIEKNKVELVYEKERKIFTK